MKLCVGGLFIAMIVAIIAPSALAQTSTITDWTTLSGNWAIDNNGLTSSGVSAEVVSSNSFPSDRTVDITMKTLTTTGTGSNCCPYYVARANGKYVDFYNKVFLDIWTNGVVNMVIATYDSYTNHGVQTSLNPLEYHDVRMVFKADNIVTYVDGILVHNVTDARIGALGNARVALSSWGDSTSGFKPVTVTALTAPAPTISISPDHGGLGTKVTVQGQGFPPSPPGIFRQVLVTFDDQLVGFATPTNGSFTFVFNVQHAEDGNHTIVAEDLLTNASARASFIYIGETIIHPVTLSLDVGTIYFQGDTVVMYGQSSLNGVPFDVGILSLIVFRPDGSNITVGTTRIGAGVLRGSYSIPSTGTLGTYAISASLRYQGQSVSTLRAFEVKLSWLSPQARNIGSAVAGTSALAALGVVFWKRSQRKKAEDLLPSPA